MTRSIGNKHAISQSVRQLRASARCSPFLERVLAGIPSGGGVVLRYHSVNDDAGWAGDYLQPSLGVAPRIFDRQMAYVSRRCRVVSIEEIADAIRERRPIGRRCAAITFDDGYEDNYRNAFPILRKHGLTAAFYITTGAVADEDVLWTTRLRFCVQRSPKTSLTLPLFAERPVDLSHDAARESAVRCLTAAVKQRSAAEASALLDQVFEQSGVRLENGDRRVMMDWDEIREMHRAGMTIGAHTVSHYNLPSLEASELVREIRVSKRVIEGALGAAVDHFAYPNGRTELHFDRNVATAVAGAGFKSAVTSLGGTVTSRCSEFAIPRLGVRKRHWDVRRFATDVQVTRFSRAEHTFSTQDVLRTRERTPSRA